MKDNLIKLTLETGNYTRENQLLGKLYELGINPGKKYNRCSYTEKLKFINYLNQLFHIENHKMKSYILSNKILPREQWRADKTHLPVLTLLISYLISVKVYMDSFCNFTTTYLEDMKNYGMDIDNAIYKKNKYDNLYRFMDDSNLNELQQIRNDLIHGDKNCNYALGYEAISDQQLNVMLIKILFDDLGEIIQEKFIYINELENVLDVIVTAENKFVEYVSSRSLKRGSV